MDSNIREAEKIIALAGNPNVGKSTVFNALTGLNQHTGNWPGKTVTHAQGYCRYKDREYELIDLPGCYSLAAHSAEEEVARDFICSQKPDAVIVVCDATCLERNLNLVLQVLEITPNTIVCINLMDEAAKKKIQINTGILSKLLGVPVVETSARNGQGIDRLLEKISMPPDNPAEYVFKVPYPDYLEDAVSKLLPVLEESAQVGFNARWLALRILENDMIFTASKYLHTELEKDRRMKNLLAHIKKSWSENGITERQIRDDIVRSLVKAAESISLEAVVFRDGPYNKKDRNLDKILTSKLTGFPIMFLMLMFIFWLTITGANYPSRLLSSGLFWLEDHLFGFLLFLNVPMPITEALVLGVYRVLAWVVSVMLPPMAIFFPLFTLLEDSGYLPRIAFNLDKIYKKCHTCGKQALTMCMGFGCNAAGVIGCRIIDSPRERLIAIITNNFVPCNGRFPPYQPG